MIVIVMGIVMEMEMEKVKINNFIPNILIRSKKLGRILDLLP
jgi:hypothetical protein